VAFAQYTAISDDHCLRLYIQLNEQKQCGLEKMLTFPNDNKMILIRIFSIDSSMP